MAIITFDRKKKLISLDIGIVSSDESSLFYLPVVLDTGATMTLLPADILANLRYDPGNPCLPRTRMITGSGIEYSPCIIIKELIVGGESGLKE